MARSDPQPVTTASTSGAAPEARAPDGLTLYAIGDIHGRADLLQRLIDQIRADRAGAEDRAELIFLGDYIDRGPDASAVIDLILDLQHDSGFSVTTLKGNHESLALQFLADPAVGHFWCHIGGRQTLLSYGVTPPVGPSDMEQWEAVRRAFEAALPETHLSFLRQLGIYAVRGDYVFVHAGLRPGIKLARQREWDMLWIRHEFLNHRGRFEKIVVHGHTPEEQPFVGRNRIGIDTGADATDRLTGLKLIGAERRLMSSGNAHAPRAIERAARQLPRPLPATPLLPRVAVPTVRAAAAATAWRPFMARARAHAAVPAGLAALAAVYLAVSLTDTPPGPTAANRPGTAAGAGHDIDDLIARADEALVAAKGSATTTTTTPQAPAVAVMPPPVTIAVEQVPATTPEPREAAGPTPADIDRSPVKTAATAPPIDHAALARDGGTGKPAAPGGKQAGTARTAATTGPLGSGDHAADPKPPAAPRAGRAPTGDGPVGLASRESLPTVIGGSLPSAGSASDMNSPGAGYVRSIPLRNSNRIGPLDYPNGSVRADEEGIVGVRYVVATNGRVSSCTTTETSSFARLDKRTCELIRSRFRFQPATRDGQPVEEVREQRIRWKLSG